MVGVVVPVVRSAEDEAHFERRARILDAAERCFVRSGFHRTTMQDIAAEARMSPGNLYRYFPSKDSLVAGLTERDRAEMTQDFAGMVDAGDFLATLAALGRKHLAEAPREKAVLCLEIWAEATRNPAVAETTRDFDYDVIARLTGLFEDAKQRGAIAPGVDPKALAVVVSTFANGLFVRRALMPDFDPSREIAYVMAVIEAACDGRLSFPSGGKAPAD